MRPIIVRDSRVPGLVSWFFPVAAITLWPFVFIRPGADTPTLINHESIHIKQYSELLVLGFLLVYIYDWVRGLIIYRDADKAYRAIRFEQEAYENDEDLEYLPNRPRYNWIKYGLRRDLNS